MSNDTIIEAMARALCREYGRDPEAHWVRWQHMAHAAYNALTDAGLCIIPSAIAPKRPDISWIASRSEPDLNTGCWLWRYRTNRFGYGKAQFQRRSWAAHRLAAHLGGMNIEGKDVCHKCDTKLCVNPAHLFTGTHEENMRDKVAKGRASRHGGVGKILTEDEIAEIVRTCIPGDATFGLRAMARKYNMSHGAIRFHLARRTPAFVPGDRSGKAHEINYIQRVRTNRGATA